LEAGLAWIVLFIAGLFETAWAIGLKQSDGLAKPGWAAFTLVTLVISMVLLGWSLKTLPVGTGYAVWTGIGAVGAAVLGIVLFREPATLARLFCLSLIIAGIVGLKFVTPEQGS
jgi:quaternary ammonium compound-resistance protein SugE